MNANDALDEAAALTMLGDHERALNLRLEGARQEVAALLADARRAADRLREQADIELRAEIEAVEREASRDLERRVDAIRSEGARQIDLRRSQGLQNRDRVLMWLLSQVDGGGP